MSQATEPTGMSVTPKWKDERQTTIVVTYQNPWTWDEFDEAALATNALMKSVDYHVVLIEDTSHGGLLPPGNVVAHGKWAIANFPNNLALIVVVVNSSLIRTFLSIVAGMNPGGRKDLIKTAPTLEKAYAMAEEALSEIRTCK
jgi:hypothetical protein